MADLRDEDETITDEPLIPARASGPRRGVSERSNSTDGTGEIADEEPIAPNPLADPDDDAPARPGSSSSMTRRGVTKTGRANFTPVPKGPIRQTLDDGTVVPLEPASEPVTVTQTPVVLPTQAGRHVDVPMPPVIPPKAPDPVEDFLAMDTGPRVSAPVIITPPKVRRPLVASPGRAKIPPQLPAALAPADLEPALDALQDALEAQTAVLTPVQGIGDKLAELLYPLFRHYCPGRNYTILQRFTVTSREHTPRAFIFTGHHLQQGARSGVLLLEVDYSGKPQAAHLLHPTALLYL